MWDWLFIYIVIDFGCDKICDELGVLLKMMVNVLFIYIGYNLNNGCVLILLLFKVGKYGDVDSDILQIYGFDYNIGKVIKGVNNLMWIEDIYIIIVQMLDVLFLGMKEFKVLKLS